MAARWPLCALGSKWGGCGLYLWVGQGTEQVLSAESLGHGGVGSVVGQWPLLLSAGLHSGAFCLPVVVADQEEPEAEATGMVVSSGDTRLLAPATWPA